MRWAARARLHRGGRVGARRSASQLSSGLIRAVLFDFDFTLADSLRRRDREREPRAARARPARGGARCDPPHGRPLAAAHVRAAAPVRGRPARRRGVQSATSSSARTRSWWSARASIPKSASVLARAPCRGRCERPWCRPSSATGSRRSSARDGAAAPVRRDRRRRGRDAAQARPRRALCSRSRSSREPSDTRAVRRRPPRRRRGRAARGHPLRRRSSPGARAREEFAALPVERFIGSLRAPSRARYALARSMRGRVTPRSWSTVCASPRARAGTTGSSGSRTCTRSACCAAGSTAAPRRWSRSPNNPSGLGWLPDGRLLVVSMNDRQAHAARPGRARGPRRARPRSPRSTATTWSSTDTAARTSGTSAST